MVEALNSSEVTEVEATDPDNPLENSAASILVYDQPKSDYSRILRKGSQVARSQVAFAPGYPNDLDSSYDSTYR